MSFLLVLPVSFPVSEPSKRSLFCVHKAGGNSLPLSASRRSGHMRSSCLNAEAPIICISKVLPVGHILNHLTVPPLNSKSLNCILYTFKWMFLRGVITSHIYSMKHIRNLRRVITSGLVAMQKRNTLNKNSETHRQGIQSPVPVPPHPTLEQQ